jgi:hypothetical protein
VFPDVAETYGPTTRHRCIESYGPTTRHRWVALLLAMLVAMPAAAQTVEVLAIDPPDGSLLRVGDSLYVRLGYTGDQPLRFRVRGYLAGSERIEGTRASTAPPYPAGAGEALAWIEYTRPIALDELRIEVYDAHWAELTHTVVPVDIGWRADASLLPRSRAVWVTPLSDAQQQMTREALTAAQQSDADGWWTLLIMLMGWSVPGYFILQYLLYRRWQGGWRKLALLPLAGAVPIVAYTLFALAMGSNIWPLVMLFTLPLAFLYLVALVIMKRFAGAGS